MNDIDQFRQYLSDCQPALKIWGNYVSNKVCEQLANKLGDQNKTLSFIKILSEPRVKALDSAIGKIARKGYTNPSEEMTDLVGMRFVVLLSSDLDLISEIISSELSWTSAISKDFTQEIKENPKVFDYQSKHFEVRPKSDVTIDGVLITTNICCEVQIRTLLQHAYAELVHDNFYKATATPAPHTAERQIAKSMALMETTDELFCTTMSLIKSSNLKRDTFFSKLEKLYLELIGYTLLRTDLKTNYSFLDDYLENIDESTLGAVEEYIKSKPFIATKIRERALDDSFFMQPISLYAYWLASTLKTELQNKWPLPGYFKQLDTIFSDLSIG